MKEDGINQIIRNVRMLVQFGNLYSKKLNNSHQVTLPQLNVLLELHNQGPLPLSTIAKRIMVERSTVTGIVDRLVHKSLVKRVRNSQDRRFVMVGLTDMGKRFATSAPPSIPPRFVNSLRNLPIEDLKQIVECLSKLTSMLDEAILE
jgi:DNA-binding MarR family transcriptional regulator